MDIRFVKNIVLIPSDFSNCIQFEFITNSKIHLRIKLRYEQLKKSTGNSRMKIKFVSYEKYRKYIKKIKLLFEKLYVVNLKYLKQFI